MASITLILEKAFTAYDLDANHKITMLPNEYEMDEIKDPSGNTDHLFLVRKGARSKMGAATKYWEQYVGKGVSILRK